MSNLAIIELLNRFPAFLIETASEEAKKHNLKHVGGGAWADASGNVVAKTNRKTKELEWLKDGPQKPTSNTTSKNDPADTKQDASSLSSANILNSFIDGITIAVNKLTNLIAAIMFDDPANANDATKKIFRTAIIQSIHKGTPVLPEESTLTSDQIAELESILDQYILTPKNKLTAQIKGYLSGQTSKSDQEPPQTKKTPFTPKTTGGTGDFSYQGALAALGMDPNLHQSNSALKKLITSASIAKNQNRLNYIGATLIKLGLTDKEHWKAFRKYHRAAFGVLPAKSDSSSTEEPVAEPEAPSVVTAPEPEEEPKTEPELEPAPSVTAALSNPNYKYVSALLSNAGIDLPLHFMSNYDIDHMAADLSNVYNAANSEQLYDALKDINWLLDDEKGELDKYLHDTYPNVFGNTNIASNDDIISSEILTQKKTIEWWFNKANINFDEVITDPTWVPGIFKDLESAALANNDISRYQILEGMYYSGILTLDSMNSLFKIMSDSYNQAMGKNYSSVSAQNDDEEYVPFDAELSGGMSHANMSHLNTFNQLSKEAREKAFALLKTLIDKKIVNEVNVGAGEGGWFILSLGQFFHDNDKSKAAELGIVLSNKGWTSGHDISDLLVSMMTRKNTTPTNDKHIDTPTSNGDTPDISPPADEPKNDIAQLIQDYQPSIKAQKATETSMKGWAKGDAEKVMKWASKMYGKQPIKQWADVAMTLAQKYGFPSDQIPDELLIAAQHNQKTYATPKDIITSTEPEDSITPSEPEKPLTPSTASSTPTEEAISISSGYLSNFGIDVQKLNPAYKDFLITQVSDALESTTDFGVVHAINKLKVGDNIASEVIDGLAIEIIDNLASAGKLNDNPDAFKEYFDPSHFTDKFFAENPTFAKGLSAEQKNHINDVVKKGLSLKDDPGAVSGSGSTTPGKMTGYQKAKALYASELSKIPGFTPDMLQKFRSGAKQYHDELKNLTKYIAEKKAAATKAKQDAKELQDALAMLSSSGSKGAIDALVNTPKVSTPQKTTLTLAVAKALNQPSSQQMFDVLNSAMSSFSNAYAGNAYPEIGNMSSSDVVKFKSLVAATYFDKKDATPNYTNAKSPESASVRTKRVLSNWARDYGVTLGHFPKHSSFVAPVSERESIASTVMTALMEPDNTKVNGIVNSLFATATSMSDKQINQLKSLIHAERKSPGGTSGIPAALTFKKYTGPQGTPIPKTVLSGNEAKSFVGGLSAQQDPSETASYELVPGEEVRVSGSHLKWEMGSVSRGSGNYGEDLNKQQAWMKQHRSNEDIERFNSAKASWQGSGQWSKSPLHRKAMNEIMTRIIEGPPPLYAYVPKHVERGMSINAEEFKEYIKAFKVGQAAYIGPSGFSANTQTAYNFGADPNSQSQGYVKVRICCLPDKEGKMKSARLGYYGSEEECVLGTNNQMRTEKVIKHVTMLSNGQALTAYEIILRYDESIPESVVLGESTGFNAKYWNGLSKQTVAALIKYNNTPVNTTSTRVSK